MTNTRVFSHLLAAISLGAALLALSACTTAGTRESVVRPEAIHVASIIQWSKDGMPPKEIIQKLRDSGTVYRLRADQIVRLHSEGVSTAVLNYMEATYVDAVSRDRARRYLRVWNPYGDGYYYGGVPFGWEEPTVDFDQEEGGGN